MRGRAWVAILAPLALLAFLGGPTVAADGGGSFRARLSGYQEVPSISTVATGRFHASVAAGPVIEYRLSYTDIENAFAGHIHFGQAGVNGGVSAFLCGGGDKPPCPATGGTVTDTIDAADVIGPSSQGIAAGEFEELIAAMRAGVTYVNVHTNDGVDPANTGPGDFPGGEIRGQIK